jgi:hypothetical protein
MRCLRECEAGFRSLSRRMKRPRVAVPAREGCGGQRALSLRRRSVAVWGLPFRCRALDWLRGAFQPPEPPEPAGAPASRQLSLGSQFKHCLQRSRQGLLYFSLPCAGEESSRLVRRPPGSLPAPRRFLRLPRAPQGGPPGFTGECPGTMRCLGLAGQSLTNPFSPKGTGLTDGRRPLSAKGRILLGGSWAGIEWDYPQKSDCQNPVRKGFVVL